VRRIAGGAAVGLLVLVLGCGDADPGEVEAVGGATTSVPASRIAEGAAISYRVPAAAGVDVLEVLRDRVESLGFDGAEVVDDGDVVTVRLAVDVDEATGLAARLGAAGRLEMRPAIDVQPFITTAQAASAGESLGDTTPVGVTGCELLGATTRFAELEREAGAVLPGVDDAVGNDDDDEPESCFLLGPLPVDGGATLGAGTFVGAEAVVSAGEPAVTGAIADDRIDLFNTIAEECFARSARCPTGQLALVLDDVVLSAPTIQEPRFTAAGIQISGLSSQQEAATLAAVLRFAPLGAPLELIEVVEID
jgi:preprotein translocase subunit SecD